MSQSFDIRTIAAGTQLYHWGAASAIESWSDRGSIDQSEIDRVLQQAYQGLRSGTYASCFPFDSIAHGTDRLTIRLPHAVDVVVAMIAEGSLLDNPFYLFLHEEADSGQKVEGKTYKKVITAAQLGRLNRGVNIAGLEERQEGSRIRHIIFQDASSLTDVWRSSSDELLADLAHTGEDALEDHAAPTALLQSLIVQRLAHHLCKGSCTNSPFSLTTVHDHLRAHVGQQPSWAWMLTALAASSPFRPRMDLPPYSLIPAHGLDKVHAWDEEGIRLAEFCTALGRMVVGKDQRPSTAVGAKLLDNLCRHVKQDSAGL